MKHQGRLLIVESVLPAGDEPHPGKILDLVMLTVPGGVERSGEEYAKLAFGSHKSSRRSRP